MERSGSLVMVRSIIFESCESSSKEKAIVLSPTRTPRLLSISMKKQVFNVWTDLTECLPSRYGTEKRRRFSWLEIESVKSHCTIVATTADLFLAQRSRRC